MFKQIAVVATFVLSLSARSGTARADGDASGVAIIAPLIVGWCVASVSAPIFGLIDVVERPTSKRYAYVEFAFNAPMVVVDLLLVSGGGLTAKETGVIAGLGALHIATTAHAIYLVSHEDRPLRVGPVKGRLAPTVVGDSRGVGGGLGFSGSF